MDNLDRMLANKIIDNLHLMILINLTSKLDLLSQQYVTKIWQLCEFPSIASSYLVEGVNLGSVMLGVRI